MIRMISSCAIALFAATALHAEGLSAASATRSAARFDVAATVAAAMNLSGALFAAMPAISAGLCARRRRNRQCGDARGKE